MTLIAAFPLCALDSAGQERLAIVKQAMAADAQKLTTQCTLNGEQKPPTQNLCPYGPDGKVQKTQYMGKVKAAGNLHLPPDPQKMEQAKQTENLSVNLALGAVNLIFNNYVQQGDQMALTFNTVVKKVSSVNVNTYTYMADTQDAVTLLVQMASLLDGTNYAQQTAKQLVVPRATPITNP